MNFNLKKEKKFNVWSSFLQEENLCDNLNKIEIELNLDENNNTSQERGVESYPYKKLSEISQKEFANKSSRKNTPLKHIEHIKNHLTSSNDNLAIIKTKLNECKELPVKDRLGPMVCYDEHKSRAHIKASEFDTDEVVTKEIAKHLREPNVDLICRCVQTLGKKKALELLYATEDVQQRGGMLTAEGNRKRTPGGVYLQLLKRDETILKCQMSKILIKDEVQKKKKNQRKRLKQKLKFEKVKQELMQNRTVDELQNKQDVSMKQDKIHKTITDSSNYSAKIQESGDEMDQIKEDQLIYLQ